MKTYTISRDGDRRVSATVRTVGGVEHALQHVRYHSDGFETGYAGSGPADLALSILADYLSERFTGDSLRKVTLGDDAPRAWQLHHRFKAYFIAPQNIDEGESYSITSDEIDTWISQQPQ